MHLMCAKQLLSFHISSIASSTPRKLVFLLLLGTFVGSNSVVNCLAWLIVRIAQIAFSVIGLAESDRNSSQTLYSITSQVREHEVLWLVTHCQFLAVPHLLSGGSRLAGEHHTTSLHRITSEFDILVATCVSTFLFEKARKY